MYIQIYRFGILGALHIAQCAGHFENRKRNVGEQNIEYIGVNRIHTYAISWHTCMLSAAKENVGDFSARGHLSEVASGRETHRVVKQSKIKENKTESEDGEMYPQQRAAIRTNPNRPEINSEHMYRLQLPKSQSQSNFSAFKIRFLIRAAPDG